MTLPWPERVTQLSIHPDAADRNMIARLATEHMALAEALRQLLLDLREHAHGNPVPGHTTHIRRGWEALAAAGEQP